jgi:hypothetical protein
MLSFNRSISPTENLHSPNFHKNKRYGREDEEVMGLKFCNEAVIAFQQIWPKIETEQRYNLSPLQVDKLDIDSILS